MPTTTMSVARFNKYRAAVEILQKGRELVVEAIADDVLDKADELLDCGYQFHEFLETQGTRLHFLGMMIQQLEQSADEAEAPPPPPPVASKAAKPRKPRAKKLTSRASAEGKTEDA